MNAIHQVFEQSVEQHAPQPFKDKKRYLWLLGPSVPVIAIAAMAAYQFGPRPMKKIFAGFGPLFIHGIVPALDKLMGEDTENPPLFAVAALEKDPYYAALVKSYIPLQYAANLYGAYLASRKNTSLLDQVLLGTLLGVVNGVGINTAHELSHKASKVDHYLSHAALLPSGYIHFRIEHPYGHHKRVATPEDPASSQMGESFWQFLPRTVMGSFKSAIEIETRRLTRKKLSFWSKHNELIHGWVGSIALHSGLVKTFGKKVSPLLLTQSLYSITLFELVNYIEHYGLLRQKRADGSYERTMPEHSWNNNSVVTNLFLYQLQRHSDHHAFPTRSFQALRHFEEAPQLPAGYGAMLLPGLIPKWWFKLMDQRVVDHYQGDLSKINMYPKAKARLMRKFGMQPQG